MTLSWLLVPLISAVFFLVGCNPFQQKDIVAVVKDVEAVGFDAESLIADSEHLAQDSKKSSTVV